MQQHRITLILSTLKIPRRTYYDWLHYKSTTTNSRHQSLVKLVKVIWRQHQEYGYVRIAQVIRHQFKRPISNRTVWSVMKELGIQSNMNRHRSTKPRTFTDTPQKPNLMAKFDDLSGIVTTDITYIQLLSKKWIYLATAYDPENRKVLAYKIGSHMTAELATAPIKQLLDRKYSFKMIHSDMGSQYTSYLFENTLIAHQLRHSYSRKGKPSDNARMEAYHSLLKRELIQHHGYQTIDQVIQEVTKYNYYYNTTREINGRGTYVPRKQRTA
jgi:putative transposase